MNKDNLKKNIPLVVGIAIPILMIVFVAASIYLPALFAKTPRFDFLYAVGADHYYGQKYYVENGKLVEREIKPSSDKQNYYHPRGEIKLFLHEIKTNQSRDISFNEAKVLNLNSSIQSPDGFEITYGKNGDGIFPFFFWSSPNYGERYINGHNRSKKLNVQITGHFWDEFRFLGWVER